MGGGQWAVGWVLHIRNPYLTSSSSPLLLPGGRKDGGRKEGGKRNDAIQKRRSCPLSPFLGGLKGTEEEEEEVDLHSLLLSQHME